MITNKDIGNSKKVGRLGNQMFIISSMVGWSKEHDSCFALPGWKYEKEFPKVPVLKDFSDIKFTKYIEPDFLYHAIPDIENLDIRGYFQSYKYFKNAESHVRYYLKPNQDIRDAVDTQFEYLGLDKIRTTVLQVRRDDYLKTNKFHPVYGKKYFDMADKIIGPYTDKYVVFSDDIEWCKEHYVGDKFIFPEPDNSIGDIYFMSKCNNFIIANSTFGWWGAWLCKNDSKVVITPKKWFGVDAIPAVGDIYAMDLMPPNWIRIDSDEEEC